MVQFSDVVAMRRAAHRTWRVIRAKCRHFWDFSAIRKMADFQVILAALLSPDNETRNQAEVGARNKVFTVPTHEVVSQ